MNIKIYQLDAFTTDVFHGNPAAVIILNSWLDASLMQKIAAENNLSETAFAVQKDLNFYEIRWFTPTTEVALCGHATIAAAKVVFDHYSAHGNSVEFFSPLSGALPVEKNRDTYTLNFPADLVEKIEPIDGLYEAIGKTAIATYKGKTDLLLEFAHQKDIETLEPNFNLLKEINARGVVCTAPGIKANFVSRFFAPQSGINEDPATGSTHTLLAPFWGDRFNKRVFNSEQLSRRHGEIHCKLENDRVLISGNVIEYLVGQIKIPE